MKASRFYALVGVILLAAVFRLVPHPANFTPIAALALFSGAYLSNRRQAFLIPLLAMIVSDLFLGFHALMPVVYLSMAAAVGIGFWLKANRSVMRIGAGTLAGSILFFLTTNFAVWMQGILYPKTAAGLWACYIAALPFFNHSLIGDAFYSLALFGGWAMAEKMVPALDASVA